MISRETVEEIKEKVSLLETASKYLSFKKSGQNYFAVCPFHSEKTPSFCIKEGRDFYYCFGCGASGDIFSLVMKLEGISYPEAIEKLAKENNIAVKYVQGRGGFERLKLFYKANAFALTFFRDNFKKHLNLVSPYLNSRGISTQCAEYFELGFAPLKAEESLFAYAEKNCSEDTLKVLTQLGLVREKKDLFVNRLIFPVHNHRGQVVGFGGRVLSSDSSAPKYINSPESVVYKKGSLFYNWHRAQREVVKKKRVLIVEGYFDVMAMYMMGALNVVATCGTSLTKAHAEFLHKRLSRFGGEVVLLFDGDSAGAKAAARAAQLLYKAQVDGKVVYLLQGEDPHSLYLKHKGDKKWFKECRKASFIEAYLLGLLMDLGVQSVLELSSIKRSALLDELLSLPACLDNALLVAEALKEISLLLKVPLDAVSARFKKIKKPLIKTYASEREKEAVSVPLRDLQFLSCVLAIGSEAALLAVKTSEVCATCSESVLSFLTEFSKIELNLKESESIEQYFSQVKSFVEEEYPFFSKCVQHAEQMARDKEVAIEKLYNECREH